MIVVYNILVIIAVAIIVKLGTTYTDYEEYFVMIGVVDIIYFICVLFYMMFG
jgi:hypothetical protein